MAIGYQQCWKLTPDIHGSYVNGTWTSLAPMHYPRQYFASDVLVDGRVFVAGGEYGQGGIAAEVYDPINNTWTVVQTKVYAFQDAESKLVAGGNRPVSPVSLNEGGGTVLWRAKLEHMVRVVPREGTAKWRPAG